MRVKGRLEARSPAPSAPIASTSTCACAFRSRAAHKIAIVRFAFFHLLSSACIGDCLPTRR